MPQNTLDEEADGQPAEEFSLIASVATPAGRGAIATVLVAGPRVLQPLNKRFRAASGRQLEEIPDEGVCFGYWRHHQGVEEEIVIARVGNTVEIQCHGGSSAAASILKSLEQLGCVVLSWTDWLRRQSSARIQEEATHALVRATTRRTATLLLAQYQGALSAEIQEIIGLVERSESRRQGLVRLRQLIGSASVGLRLVDPWCVVLAGPPNVGKSSLINALAGFKRAIVYKDPGTTRDVLSISIALDGWPMQLMDTAGLRTTTDAIERAGVSRATASLANADLVVLVKDASRPTLAWSHQDSIASDTNTIAVLNKIDLGRNSETVQSDDIIMTSAVTGQGLGELRDRIVQKLIPHPPQNGSVLMFTQRQLRLACHAESLIEENRIPEALTRLSEIDS